MPQINYKCPKCDNRDYMTGEIRTTGGFWTKIFDVQNEKFSYISCKQCTYTEFYKSSSSALGNIFDFFTN